MGPQVLIPKVVVGVTWLLALASFFVPAGSSLSGLAGVGRFVFYALAATHTVECLLFLGTLRRSSRPLALELVQVFLFGVVHYGQVRRELEEAEAAAS